MLPLPFSDLICPQVLCASPAYLQAKGAPERPEDLLEHRCIIYSLLSSPREWRFKDAQGESHVVPITSALQSNNGVLNRSAAIAGAGIVLLLEFYIGEELRSGALKPILSEFIPVELAIYALYPEHRNLTPKVHAIVDSLAAAFSPAPWEIAPTR